MDIGPHRLKGLAAPERIHALKGPASTHRCRSPTARIAACWPSRPEDRAFFFGREDVVRDLLDRLAPGRLVALVGASGSGKSSVLRAGLAAAVEAGEVDGIDSVRLLTPGADPRLDVPGKASELVIVDQFEELFTLCHDPARRRDFIDALLDLPGPVVIGVRADLYGQLSTHAGLARAAADNQILLGAMTDDGAPARGHRAGAAGRAAARARTSRARAARRLRRARRAPASLARAASDLGAARRPDADGRGLPGERRRRLGCRPDRRHAGRVASPTSSVRWCAASSCG